MKLFFVQVRSWEIQIKLRSFVYIRANDALAFILSKFSMAIVFTKVRLAHNVIKTLSKINLPIILWFCSNVLNSVTFYQQRNNLTLKVA